MVQIQHCLSNSVMYHGLYGAVYLAVWGSGLLGDLWDIWEKKRSGQSWLWSVSPSLPQTWLKSSLGAWIHKG